MVKAAALLAVLFLAGGTARADALPPCAGQFDALITCAAADVGKPCQGGGQCYEISCLSGSGSSSVTGKVYKCDACPTIVASSAECSIPNLGKPCGADGSTAICGGLWPHCDKGGSKFACQTPATDKPTGPPSSGTASSSGCDVVPRPPKPTAIGLGLLAVGVMLFLIDRLRRRRSGR